MKSTNVLFKIGAVTIAASIAHIYPTLAVGQTAAERGSTLMEEVDRRASGYGDFTATLTMTLRDSEGSERQREMHILGLEIPDDGDRTLVIFDQPADLRGTSILTANHRDGSTEQWLYLPALRRSRRIASSDRTDRFMGSQFTYEDMGSQDPTRFTHLHLRDDTRDGLPVHVVESTPTDLSSGYTRQVLWLDTEELRIQRIDYFDGEAEAAKTLILGGYQEYEGGHWRPGRMVMTNHRSSEATVLEWQDYAFLTGLSAGDFDPRRLGRRE